MSLWRDAEAQFRAFARNLPLRILVWGPGDPGPRATGTRRRQYQKRIQIRDVLRRTFPRADVRFSEDPLLQAITAYAGGQLRREAIHARLAHVVLMLTVSRGADLELDHFVPTYDWFREKVYVFMPQRHVRTAGLVRDVLDRLHPSQVQGFTPRELTSCEVATVRSVEAVDAVATNLLLRDGPI